MLGKKRLCKYCQQCFVPKTTIQKFCSTTCRDLYHRFHYRKELEERRQEESMQEWHRVWDNGLKRNVCRWCFRMTFDPVEKEYCSSQCEQAGKES